jgi:glycosyltransferase involved in cell wall biosynthesis
MKNILVIYPEYSEGITGGQVYDKMFIESLRKDEKFHVDFLLDKDLCATKKYLYSLAYLFKLNTCRKYDYILTNSRLYTRLFALFLLLRLFRVKTYSIHHHFNFEGEVGFKRFIHKTLELFFLRVSTATIIPSPYVKDRFAALLPKSKQIYVPLGVKKAALKDKIPTKQSDVLNLLYVGTIEKRKGLLYLVESLKLLSNKTKTCKCHIVGKVVEEDYKAEIDKKIVEYQLTDNVIFHGRLSNQDLDAIYSNSDIFVFPSMLEGYGMVLLEAMSYSLPIVAFDNSAMPYTVKTGKTGILVENKNVEHFAAAIQKLAEDKAYYNSIIANTQQVYSSIRTEEDLQADIYKTIELIF